MRALLLGVLILASGAAPEGGWSKPWRTGSFTVEKRPVTGSSVSEFRVTTESPLTPSALCDAAFEMASRDQRNPSVRLTRMLRDGVDERVVYNQVHHAFITDRDYAMTVTRTRLPDGACAVVFRITNDQAPPLPAGYLRMERLRGTWSMSAAAGKTRVVHTLFADPGGSIPGVLLEGEAEKTTEHDTQMLFQIARERGAR